VIEAHSQLLVQIRSNSRALAAAAGARPLRSLRNLLRCWFGLIARMKRTHTKFRLLTPRACAGPVARIIQALGGVAAFIAVVALWNFSTLSPCGVLREAARQRDSLAAVLPDSIVDLGLEGQYGPLSSDRCLAVMMRSVVPPILSTAQSSRPQMMQPVRLPAPVPPVKVRETERRHDVGAR
jgi:hypothetical protein